MSKEITVGYTYHIEIGEVSGKVLQEAEHIVFLRFDLF